MKKKNFPLILVHLVLMLGSLIFYLAYNLTAASGIQAFIDMTLIVITYLCGILYLVFGFRKEYAFFYKMFMVALLVEAAFSVVMAFTSGTGFTFSLLLEIIAIIMIILLAFVKDIGKTRAILFAIIFLICRLATMMITLLQSSDLAAISRAIAGFLLAGTAAIMVTEKYLDKIDRGTN